MLLLFCQRNKEEGLFWDKRGCLRPLRWPLLKVVEGPKRRWKVKRPLQCLRNETLCPATVPITQSSEFICTGIWGLELGFRHWNNSGTIESSLIISHLNQGTMVWVPGPPWIWFPAHCCWAWGGPWDLMGSVWGQSFFQCPHCLQVGQGLVGGQRFGQDLAQCPVWLHLKQGPGELGPIRVGQGWWAKGVEFFSWLAAANKAYLAFLSYSFFASSSPSLKTLRLFLGDLTEGFCGPSLTGIVFGEYRGLLAYELDV